MNRRIMVSLVSGLFAAVLWVSQAAAVPVSSQERSIHTRINSLQMPFVENKGQCPADTAFYADTLVGRVIVTQQGELKYLIHDPQPDKPSVTALTETLIDAKPLNPQGLTPSQGTINIFKGNHPEKWHKNIPSFQSLTLGEVYAGITVTMKAYGKNVEKLFHVAAGADPRAIRIQVKGAETLKVLPDGQLVIRTAIGDLKLTKPVAFQHIDGEKQMIDAAYQVSGDEYAFKLGAYDPNTPLIIDPLFATYLGGSDREYGYALKVNTITEDDDSQLYIYVTGYTTTRSDFPGLDGAAQTTSGGGESDVYVARLDMDLKVLNTTYIGGRGEDVGCDLAINPETDNVYVVGYTDSTDFPEAYAGGRGGERDGFIVVLNPNLSAIVQSRYVGGSVNDTALSLDFDFREEPDTAPDALYVVGYTMSGDFPVSDHAAQTIHGSNYSLGDGFIARFNAETLVSIQASFLGGGSTDHAYGVDVDDITHEVYVVGDTAYDIRENIWVGSFPWLDPADFGGQYDTFVVRMSDDLGEVINAAYVGGSGIDYGNTIAVNHSTHQIYVAGSISPRTNPAPPPVYLDDFPATEDGFQPELAGGIDAFITRLSQDLTIERSTHLGGRYFDRISDILLSNDNSPAFDVYVLGTTQSDDFPGTESGYSRHDGFYSVFLARLSSDLDELHSATYLGGTGTDESHMHGLDMGNDPHNGSIWLFAAGQTSSTDFPGVLYTADDTAAQPVNAGGMDTWVARLNPLYCSGNPEIELQPRSHDFGNQRLNVAATPLSVRFGNLGGEPLNISAVFLQGADQEDYALDFSSGTESCGSPPFNVASADICTVNVIFTPSVDNVYRVAQVVVQTGNDSDEPELLIDLTGYSGPDISIITEESTPAVDPEPNTTFPMTEIGSTTRRLFTIQNDGYSNLVISGISKTGISPDTGENFSLDYDILFGCPDPADGAFTLSPRGNCSVAVDFTPTYPANQEALVVIFSNDLDEDPETVQLLGPGVTELTADIYSYDLDFYDVPISRSRSLPLVISNAGGQDLEILSYTLSDYTDFSIDTNGGAVPCESLDNVLEPFSSCTATVTFHPYTAATFDETLTMTSNDPDEASFSIHFRGRSSADSDGDYVLDIEEAGDANGDGIDDAQQANVAVLHSIEQDHYIIMEADGDAQLQDVRAQRTPTDAWMSGFDFPFGFYRFRAILGPSDDGANITMTVMNADGTPADPIETYVKYGPTTSNPDYHYYDLATGGPVTVNGTDYPNHVTVSGNVISLHMRDGGLGDSDDTDGDGQGEVNGEIYDPGGPAIVTVATDSDGDTIPDSADNCPAIANTGQQNQDGDSQGDACDSCPQDADNDADSDGVCGDVDNCPAVANDGQTDTDIDGIGDACDTCPNDAENDSDGDGLCADADNCPDTDNPDQLDSNGNGIGDACDTDPSGSGDDDDDGGSGGGGGGGGCYIDGLMH